VAAVARVLAVDDEPQVLTVLGRSLGRAGHEVVVARTGEEALVAAATASPDVILLDLRLPDVDGIEVVRRLRAWSAVPVVLLSGASSERAKVLALDAGADDFVDKPFSTEELRARLGAVLRRAVPGPNGDGGGDQRATTRPTVPGPIEVGELRIDLEDRRLRVGGADVRLTPLQWRLLEALVADPGRLLTYRTIISRVWDERHGDEARDSLRVHLRALRRKLGDDASCPRYIATEPGVGYRWVGTGT
jgi:two-component system, OmpR family, KDP operon response regulator KdpE